MSRSFLILGRQPFRRLRDRFSACRRVGVASLWVDWLTFAKWEHAPDQGQLVFERRALAERTGVAESQIRTLMEKLVEMGEITVDTGRRGTTITLCNYEIYADVHDFIALNRQTFYQFRRQFSLKHRAPATALWIECLLRANYVSTFLDGQPMGPGDLVLGRGEFGAAVGVSVQKTRTLLDKLERSDEIARKATNLGTRINIRKYWAYVSKKGQIRPQSNQQLTSKQPASNHSEQRNKETSTTNGEDVIRQTYLKHRSEQWPNSD